MITSLVRSNLKGFKPYSSARSKYTAGIFFDANENPFGSVVGTPLCQELNRYPDPYSMTLRNALASFLGIKAENIFVGNGSDEAIDLITRLFVEPYEEVIVTEPTYGMYAVAGELANVAMKRCPLRPDFTLNVDALLKAAGPKTKLLFCCSPNNPTGTVIPLRDIEKLCRRFKGIVVLDEAYIEFSSTSSAVEEITRFENLVVLRTFSKAWGLAGIRVGYAVAQKEIVDYLNRIKMPYNISRISSQLAVDALTQYPKMIAQKDLIIRERSKLSDSLKKLGLTVFPSEANFLLTRFPNASAVATKLAKEYGFIVRDFSSTPLLTDCVRISVGTPEQNRMLVETLIKLL